MKPQFLIVNKGSQVAEAFLYGNVGEYYDVNSKKFSNEYRQLQLKNKLIHIRLNSKGGDVFEGNAIHNLILESEVETHTHNDGVAASIGAMIFMSGHKRYMAKNALLMFHAASGGAYGQASKLRKAADTLEKVNKLLIDTIVAQTTNKRETVEKWFENETDTWFTAEEALKAGLIHGITDPRAKNAKLPESLKAEHLDEYINTFQNELESTIPEDFQETESSSLNSNPDMKNLVKLITIMAITNVDVTNEAAMELAIQNKFKEQADKILELENKLKAQADANAKSLVNSAIQDGKITEAQRANFENLAAKDYDSIKQLLDGMPKPKNLENGLTGGKTTGGSSTGENPRDKWTFENWSKNDPDGLLKMKRENAEAYQALYDAEYNS